MSPAERWAQAVMEAVVALAEDQKLPLDPLPRRLEKFDGRADSALVGQIDGQNGQRLVLV